MNDNSDIEATFGPFESVTDVGPMDGDAFHCVSCAEKHIDAERLTLPCGDCVCRDAYRTMLTTSAFAFTSRHGIPCPSCAKEMPALTVVRDGRILPLSRFNNAAFRMAHGVMEVGTFLLSPGAVLFAAGALLWLIASVLNVCVAASTFESGYCFAALSPARAWLATAAAQSVAGATDVAVAKSLAASALARLASPSAAIPIALILLAVGLMGLMLLGMVSATLARRIRTGFRSVAARRLELHYNPLML